GPVHIRHVHKESFVRLDFGIAINSYVEIVSLLPSRNRLIGQTSDDVIVICDSRSAVLCRNIKTHAAAWRWLTQTDDKVESSCSFIAFIHHDIVDAERWTINGQRCLIAGCGSRAVVRGGSDVRRSGI